MSPRPRQSDAVTTEQAEQLVEATFRVIARTGETEPDVRSILREADLSRPALYRCFGSKDGLMVAVLEEGRRLLAAYLSARMARATTPAGALQAFVEGFLRQAEDERSAVRTRPFVADPGRRALRYPAQHAETELVLSGLVERTIVDGVAAARVREQRSRLRRSRDLRLRARQRAPEPRARSRADASRSARAHELRPALTGRAGARAGRSVTT